MNDFYPVCAVDHADDLESLARRLCAIDPRVDAGLVPVLAYESCDACGQEACGGVVGIGWNPSGRLRTETAWVGVACAEEYLRSVVAVDCGDPDGYPDLIDVEIRRAYR